MKKRFRELDRIEKAIMLALILPALVWETIRSLFCLVDGAAFWWFEDGPEERN